MQRLLRSATVLSAVLGATAVQAADLTYEPAPVIEAPAAFNWTGFYIGVHGGIGGGDSDAQIRIYEDQLIASRAVSPFGVDFSDNAFGFFGGAQAGYNYQFATNWVAGVEADFAASGIKADHTQAFPDGSSVNRKAEIDWFGTIRGRLGYAWDNVLFYGTGGAAYGKINVSGYGFEPSDGDGGYSQSQIKWGWTVGAGVEYGITPNVTLKTEYLYVDLGTATFDDVRFSDYEAQGKVDTAFHTLKFGLNYKF
jgi:outer membrane immunogenic protein